MDGCDEEGEPEEASKKRPKEAKAFRQVEKRRKTEQETKAPAKDAQAPTAAAKSTAGSDELPALLLCQLGDADPAEGDADPPEEAADAKESVTEAGDESHKEEVKAEPHKGSHYHQLRLAEKAADLKLEDEGQHTVYVANLDWSVDEAHLRRVFSDVDGLKDVRLVRDFLKRSKGYAYIDFDSSAHVGEAVEKFNGQQIHKRAMRVARSLPTKKLYEEKVLFVKNIGATASEDDIKNAFSAQGEVASVRIPRDHSQEGKAHKGYAYVEFASDDSVKAALACEKPMEIGGQAVVLSRSIPMKDHRHTTAATRKDLPQRVNQRNIVQGRAEREDPVKQSSKCPTTVHVNNLAFSVDETQLTEHFQQCGPVLQVVVVRNDMGRSRGFGFVEFQEESDAQTALMFSDSLLGGREIVVSKSTRAISQKKKSKDEIEKGASKGSNKGKEKPQDKGKSKGEDKKSKGKGGKDSSRRRINLETVEKEESSTSAAIDEVPALVRPEVLDEVPAAVHPEVLDEVPELVRPGVLDEVPALTRPEVLDEVPAPVCPAVLGEVPAAVRPENFEEPAAKRPKEEAAPTNLSNADFRKFLPC